MKRMPLPHHLAGASFRVADALAAGVTPARLRSADLDSADWGVRRPRVPEDSLAARCLAVQLRIPPHAFMSHVTAALLIGAPLPLELERSAKLHISVAAPAARLHSQGIVGHRLRIVAGDVIVSAGIRRTSALRTWLDLATVLELDDLVAVGDYLIHWRQPMTSDGQLRERLEAMTGTRGVRLARTALKLLDDRPESRPESLLRLILLRSGLPAPRINHTIVNTTEGRNVRPDFIFENEKLILEYQGDYHRTKGQWRKDMTRRTQLEVQGWRVLELNADDLDDPAELTLRIRLALARPAR